MKKQSLFFIKSLLTLGVVSLFIKTYQHSMIIKRSYQKQRLEQEKSQREEEVRILQAKFTSLHEPVLLRLELKNSLNMEPMSFQQVIAHVEVVDGSITSTMTSMRLL